MHFSKFFIITSQIVVEHASKSISYRISCIMKVIYKLCECVQQVENLNQNGASKIDIVSRYNTHFIKMSIYSNFYHLHYINFFWTFCS